METGKDKALTPEQVAALGPKLPKKLNEFTSAGYRVGGMVSSRLLVSGNCVAGIAAEDGKTVLKRFELPGGKLLESIPLAGYDHHSTLDRRWVFTLAAGDGYTATLISVKSGKSRTAAVPAFPEASRIVGNRLYVAILQPIAHKFGDFTPDPRFLLAIDLKADKVLWKHPIEGKPTGPLPP